MSAQRPIGAAFARAKERGEVALVAYAMAGDPDAQGSVEVFAALADGGADIIEIGIPFSDPIADGPVILPPQRGHWQSGVRPCERCSKKSSPRCKAEWGACRSSR